MRYDVTFEIVGHKKISVCAKNKKEAEKAAEKILTEYIAQDALSLANSAFVLNEGMIECVPSKEKK